MREPFKLPFSHPVVSRIVKQAFPGSKGTRRPIGIECRDKMHIESYWSGGSKYDYGFVRLSDWTTLMANDIPRTARQAEGNVYNLPVADIEISLAIRLISAMVIKSDPIPPRSKFRIERITEGNQDGFTLHSS